MSLAQLGWDSFFDRQLSEDERHQRTPARVVWEGRGAYRLSTGTEEWLAELAGRLRHTAGSRAELPAVGDWVVASAQIIHRMLTRRSAVSRKAAGRSTDEQIVAANVDTLLLVTSLNRDFNVRRLERYLALAWESGANPALVLNKADLCGDPESLREEARTASGGVPIVITSALRGDGLSELAAIVRCGGTTALVGSSGVGKSTLINSLLGESRLTVRDIREDDERGRHATTARQLLLVPGGGVLIDTPGMRELQLWDADGGLEHAFSDIQTLAGDCRFKDCAHDREPGCAVTAAVEDGRLRPARLDSYRRLQKEERFLESRVDESARAARQRQAKRGSKAIKQIYKLRGR